MTMLYYSFTEWICFQITPDGNWYVTPIDVIFMPYISHYDGLCVVGIKAACKKAVSNRPELVEFAIRLETQPVWLAGLAGECFCLLAAELRDVWVQVKFFPLELCHLQKFLGSLPPKKYPAHKENTLRTSYSNLCSPLAWQASEMFWGIQITSQN